MSQSELNFYQAIGNLIQWTSLANEKTKMLLFVFLQRDESGEGLLKMDDIRDAYQEYCGGLVDKNEIDSMLSKCNVLVNRRGMVKYQQFIQVV